MKAFFTFLLFTLSVFNSSAQISITSATFPKTGDVLRYLVIEDGFTNLNVGTPGDNKTWNFNQLSGGAVSTESYLEKSSGTKEAAFPGANLLIRFSGNPSEFYANAINNKIELVGFAGPEPLFGSDILITYNKRPQIRRAPIFYETTARSEGEFRIDLGANVIPDTLLSQLPIRPDSIRVQISTISNDTIDAWGKLSISDKTYDVLREKSTGISETKVFIKIPFIGWLDLGMVLGGGGLPGGLDGFLGADTTITYNFYTNSIKETLLSVETDLEGNITGVTYANTGTVNTTDFKHDILVRMYPNPVADILSLELNELAHESFRLNITDISGRIVHTGMYNPSGNVRIDISRLHTGLYLLHIQNPRGTELYSSKFLKQ